MGQRIRKPLYVDLRLQRSRGGVNRVDRARLAIEFQIAATRKIGASVKGNCEVREKSRTAMFTLSYT